MAPQGQGCKWAEVLCCPLCIKVFSLDRHAVNLNCSHAVCTECMMYKLEGKHLCHLDKLEGSIRLKELPTNKAMMSIVGVDLERGLETYIEYDDDGLTEKDQCMLQNIDDSLCAMASYLRKIESERGGSVWSEVLSRTVQRKIVHIICLQLAEPTGRLRAARQARQIAERILCEVTLGSQNQQSLSHQLWTAVRARGCQFLGPGMQEDVLNLILLTMGDSALIARKTLVMYVVKRLLEMYPQTSKTCVGHVVQLLYRASCFNVLKRDGESSLMQLKEEYTTYEALRKEHDGQIVSIAIDAGLRIAPEQWSSLLYGDNDHRSHMQSIIDKLQTTASFTNGIEELRKMSDGDGLMESTIGSLKAVDDMTRSIQEDKDLQSVEWRPLRKILEALRELVDKYAEVLTRRNQARSDFLQQAVADGNDQRQSAHQAARSLVRPLAGSAAAERVAADAAPVSLTLFKTRWCREATSCTRGDRCSYAHSVEELRGGGGNPRRGGEPRGYARPPEGGPAASRWPFVPPAPPTAGPFPPQQHPQLVGPQPYPHPIIQGGGPPPPAMMMMPGHHQMMGPAGPQHHHQQWQPPPPPPHVSWLPSSEMEQQQLHHHHQGAVFWGAAPMPVKNMSLSAPSELSEVEQLHMKRDEIISRLVPLSIESDDMLNGPSTSGGNEFDDAHVAYTVASSVLDDRISDLMQANSSAWANPIIELPPMPPGYTPVINSTTTSEETLSVISELALADAAGAASSASVKARTSSLTTTTTTVRTMCPAYAFHTTIDGCTTATVQADCSTMQVTDTISEPMSTPVIVPSASVVLYAPAAEGAPGAVVAANGAVMAPSGAVLAPAPAPGASFETTSESLARDAARLPMVIQPLSQINPVQAEDPQDIVSTTLDRIVDVREKLTEVDGAASTVVKTQLEVELEIASRQIEQLDPLTTQNCLLKELEAVERKIEEIESSASNSTLNEQQQQQQQQMTYHYPQVMPMALHGMQ